MSFSTAGPVPGLFLPPFGPALNVRACGRADETGKPSTGQPLTARRHHLGSVPTCPATRPAPGRSLAGHLCRRNRQADDAHRRTAPPHGRGHPLDQVTGLTLQRTVLGRLRGYRTLIVISPRRRQAFRKARYLPYPEQLYLEISRLLRPEEQGVTTRQEDSGE